VTELITKYERQYNELLSSNGDRDESGKECSNLLVLLSELYMFQVISCVIVFDVIRDLLKGDFHETEVELLLKLVRGELQISSVSPGANNMV
jgi:nucleolar MIF4G domain-containing protein 1